MPKEESEARLTLLGATIGHNNCSCSSMFDREKNRVTYSPSDLHDDASGFSTGYKSVSKLTAAYL